MTEPEQPQRAGPEPGPELGAELAPPSARSRRVRLVLLAVALLLVAFVGGIFTQRLVGPAAASTSQGGGPRAGRLGGNPSASAQPGPGGFGGAGGGTFGSVAKVDGTTLTLTGRDGSTTTVTTNGSTAVVVSKPGALTDLPAGTQVIVQGQRNADGTVTATRISVVPANTG